MANDFLRFAASTIYSRMINPHND